jgi:hypothetical protein
MANTTSTQRATLRDADWRWIRQLFPRNLDALAKKTDAVTFFRELRSGEILLRLLLLWSLGSMGLRSVGAWAARAGWGTLTEGALRYRFRRCEAFVFELIAHALSKWLRVERAGGLALRIIDATMVAVPGPSGRSFRLHATYDPALGVMTGLELTDDSQGESTSRAPLGVRDVLIADRGYGRAEELVALSFRVVFWLIRVYLPSVPLWNTRGDRLDRACAQAGRAIERAVEIRFGGRRVRARLIIAPLPSEAAERARDQVRKRANKKGKKVDEQAELMAGFVTLLTTIDAETASTTSVLNWYRVRWQIELYFKRCKSLLRLHPVLSADDDLQRVRLLVAMLVAVIVDQMNEPAARAPEAGARSLWRLTQIHVLDLQSAVAGDLSLEQKRRRNRVVARATRERPRKRHRAHSDATMRRMHNALRSASQSW